MKQKCAICNDVPGRLKTHVSTVHGIDFYEYLCNYHYGKKVGKCLNCDKDTRVTPYKYSKYCSNKCQLEHQYKNETSEEKKQRIENISKGWTKEKREKQSKKHIEINKHLDKEYYSTRRKKAKKTKLEKYGDENYGDYGSVRFSEVMIEKYGVDNFFKIPNFYSLYLTDVDRSLKSDWVPRPVNIPKRIQTCLEKYGVEHYTQSYEFKQKSPEIVKKIWKTKKENGTTNTSKLEDSIYKELEELYPNYEIKREYKSERYPFYCDFYIKELDLFIELQGFFTHGFKSFEGTREDLMLVEKWEKKNTTFTKSSIKIWTETDVKKRKIARDNNLNFLEIFDIQNIEKQIKRLYNLHIHYTDKEIQNEINNIKKRKGTLKAKPTQNRLVKTIQKHLYEKENTLYKDPVIRRKLIQNRMKYLNKEEHELTDRELLSGFKISGIYRGFSFFSPFWFKYFIEKTNVKRVYDPFGGWGHRLLGILGTDLEFYHYNDISTKSFNGVKQMYKYFKDDICTVTFSNEDSEFYELPKNIDSIFMCPPYNKLENYGVEEKFKKLMLKVKNDFLYSPVNVLGVIIREDMISEIGLGEPDTKEIVNFALSHFNNRKTNEYLYIWRKK